MASLRAWRPAMAAEQLPGGTQAPSRAPSPPPSLAPSLAQLQSGLVTALLAADAGAQSAPAGWMRGRVPAADSLRVHRNTVLGGLSHALRLSYPAIDRLVGEDFFDRMAIAYARAHPPAEPQLAGHGAGFAGFVAGFVAGFPGTEGMPFIADLARLEWQFDELARLRAPAAQHAIDHDAIDRRATGQDAIDLGGGLVLRFEPTLRVLATRYPVVALREALLADDAARVEALAQAPGEHAQALWRSAEGVSTRPLHPAAARCIVLLQAGDALPAALEAAREGLEEAAFMDIIRADLLEAGFTTITGRTS